jgi:hypothetical protein
MHLLKGEDITHLHCEPAAATLYASSDTGSKADKNRIHLKSPPMPVYDFVYFDKDWKFQSTYALLQNAIFMPHYMPVATQAAKRIKIAF